MNGKKVRWMIAAVLLVIVAWAPKEIWWHSWRQELQAAEAENERCHGRSFCDAAVDAKMDQLLDEALKPPWYVWSGPLF